MRLKEIFHPELGIGVRYKTLDETEVQDLVDIYSHETHETFARAVLESVVHNLKTVTQALREIPREYGHDIIDSIFNGCLMLNPGLDVDSWNQISTSPQRVVRNAAPNTPPKRRIRSQKLSREKFLNLDGYLKDRVVGQDDAIEALVMALKRSQAGLSDSNRPIGVFLFAGPSGSGKSYLAKELHDYLFSGINMVRINCGEYQHKHENQKLIGSPNGYIGHEQGGLLTNALLENPHTVVLLDEVEKAHHDLWDTFLHVFDEGYLTSGDGKRASFADAVIIMTTNLGNDTIVGETSTPRVGFAQRSDAPSRAYQERAATEAIKKFFRPELLNRIDKTIIFNQLSEDDNLKIAEMEVEKVATKLHQKGFTLTYDAGVLAALVHDGINPTQGARGLSQLRRDRIENLLADVIVNGRFPKGTVFRLTHTIDYGVQTMRPSKVQTSP